MSTPGRILVSAEGSSPNIAYHSASDRFEVQIVAPRSYRWRITSYRSSASKSRRGRRPTSSTISSSGVVYRNSFRS